MAHVFISASHKSSGKTTIAMGLCAAFRERGLVVQPFKKGPDYIDPMWLGAGAGRVCYNLDYNTMSEAEILAAFWRRARGADLSVIEGNKGLYDGLDLEGGNSNAAVAILLGAPVVLVIDARGMTRGIAPLILGYQAFDPTVRIVGVILNKIGGSRHETKLRAIIEHYTDVRVLGAIHRDPALEITERHLGLIPNTETADAGTKVANGKRRLGQQRVAVVFKESRLVISLVRHPFREGQLAVSEAVVTEVDESLKRARVARARGYEGDACGECGNFTLVRNGTCMKCVTCGATSGCS